LLDQEEEMKKRAPRNRTLTCTEAELASLSTDLLRLTEPASVELLTDRVVNQDLDHAMPFLPAGFVDLLILDPPYNLTKDYNGHVFRSREAKDYITWFGRILLTLLPLLRPKASLYICSDWQTSNLIFPVLDKHLYVRNRITWEREKGLTGRTTPKISGSAHSGTTIVSTLTTLSLRGVSSRLTDLTMESPRTGKNRRMGTTGLRTHQTSGLI